MAALRGGQLLVSEVPLYLSRCSRAGQKAMRSNQSVQHLAAVPLESLQKVSRIPCVANFEKISQSRPDPGLSLSHFQCERL